MDEAKTLRATIGAHVRQWREATLTTQDEFARIAFEAGLDWRRATVASVEAGIRDIAAGELILLSIICRQPLPWWTGTGEGGPIAVTERRSLPSGVIGRVLSGELVADPDDVWSMAVRLRFASTHLGASEDALEHIRQVEAAQAKWGTQREEDGVRLSDQLSISAGAKSDAEIKAARRLGMKPIEVAALAVGLWGLNLTMERDRRADPDNFAGLMDDPKEFEPPEKTPLTLRAVRGHITRQLLKELHEAKAAIERDR